MKIIGAMICYRNELYIKHAIDGILPHVDKLIIIYGAQKEFANQLPDNTLNICVEYSQEQSDKVFLLTGKFANEAEERNVYVEFIRREFDCDFLWVIDADEFYKPEDVMVLKQLAFKYEDKYKVITYPFWNFYGRIPRGFNWYQINQIGMLKFIRFSDEIHYYNRLPQTLDNIGDEDHITLWETPHLIAHTKAVKCYHYGHVATEEDYLQKLVGSCLRDRTNPKKKHLLMATQKFREDWVRRNYPWFEPDWMKKMNLLRFDGEHPESIQKLMEANGW